MLGTFFITLLGSLIGSFGGLLLAAYVLFKYGYSKFFPKPSENNLANVLNSFMSQPKTPNDDDDLIGQVRGGGSESSNPPNMSNIMNMFSSLMENPDGINSMLASLRPPQQVDQKKDQ